MRETSRFNTFACENTHTTPPLRVALGQQPDPSLHAGYSGETDALGRGPLHYCAGVSRLRKQVSYFVEQGCSVDHQSLGG